MKKFTDSYQRLYNAIMSRPLTDDTDAAYQSNEYAFSILHAAYPHVGAAIICDAVACDWNDALTDYENINNCKYLEEYQ